MPQGAHWRAAQATDPRAIEQLEMHDLTMEDFSPPLAGWTSQMDLLATMCDWMQAAALRGAEDAQVKPYPRPKNPLGEAASQLRDEQKKAKARSDMKSGFEHFNLTHLSQAMESTDAAQ